MGRRPSGERCRFNGAAALQPRKASFVCGSDFVSTRLQWGRGSSAAEGRSTWTAGNRTTRFKGAAALQPRKAGRGRTSPVPIAGLQWGRGSSAAEGHSVLVLPLTASCFNGAAALQPRKAQGVELGLRHRCASMGPRLFSRGRCSTLPTGRYQKRSRLQWGRGSSAAEGFDLGSYLPPMQSLQWGRGSSAAEGCRRDRGRSRTARQASMGPRLFSRGRVRVCNQVPLERQLLQWGRGSSAAEGCDWHAAGCTAECASMGPRLFSRGRGRKHTSAGEDKRASMGPRLFSRGRMPLRCCETRTEGGFNGAAALQPRKDDKWVETNPEGKASMGPRLFSRGR